MIVRPSLVGLLLLSVMLSTGCRPSPANILLRKEKQELQLRVAELERQRVADRARIRGLESTTQPAVLQEQIDRLYTAHGLRFGRLTAGYRQDSQATQDEGVAVHVVPTDQDGQTLKAAGRFTIRLYDLSQGDRALVGERAFTVEEAMAAWHGRAMLFNYVLRVPFSQTPSQGEILVRVEFVDQLTGRSIIANHKAPVRLE